MPRLIRCWLSENTSKFDLLTVPWRPNILLPIDLKIHELDPALVFDDDSDQPPLDD